MGLWTRLTIAGLVCAMIGVFMGGMLGWWGVILTAPLSVWIAYVIGSL